MADNTVELGLGLKNRDKENQQAGKEAVNSAVKGMQDGAKEIESTISEAMENGAEEGAKKFIVRYKDVLAELKSRGTGARWWDQLKNKPTALNVNGTPKNPKKLQAYIDALKLTPAEDAVRRANYWDLSKSQKPMQKLYKEQFEEYEKALSVLNKGNAKKVRNEAEEAEKAQKEQEKLENKAQREQERAAEKARKEADKRAGARLSDAIALETQYGGSAESRSVLAQMREYYTSVQGMTDSEQDRVYGALERVKRSSLPANSIDAALEASGLKKAFSNGRFRVYESSGNEKYADVASRIQKPSAPDTVFGMFKKKIEETNGAIESFKNKIRQLNAVRLFGNASDRPLNFGEGLYAAAHGLGRGALAAGKFAGAQGAQAVGGIGRSAWGAVKLGGRGIKGVWKGLFGEHNNKGRFSVLDAFFGNRRAETNVGHFIKTATPLSRLLSRLTNGVKRFGGQFWRALRFKVLRQLVSKVISLAKEGMKNLDTYSQHLGTPFHKNVLALSSSLLYLKNAFAALVGPIVNALTPALTTLMDKFAMLANYIGAFFAAITGQSQFTAALEKMVTTTQQTAGKLLDILGFDELNRLSGDAGGGQDADEMFEEWGEGTIFDLLKQAFDRGAWEEIGAILAGKINKMVEGLKERELGKALGKKIGSIITMARSFLEKLDFKNMGETLATWFNNMIEGIDWDDVGRILLRSFTGVIEFFGSMIQTINWGKVGSALHDIIVGLFSGFKKWLDDVDWNQMGTDLANSIVNFIENLKIGDILLSIAGLAASLLKAIAQGIGGVIRTLLTEAFGELPDWLTKLLGGETTTIEMKATIQERVDAALSDESRGFIEKLLITLFPEKFSKAVEEQKPFVLQLFHDLNGVIGPALNVISPSTAGIFNWMDDVYDNITWVGTSVGKLATYQHTGATGAGEQPYTGGAGGGGRQTLPRNAAGGTINKGQLFIANEAGPELIGSLNGRTSVTNYDQFTQSVITANALVVDAVMQVVSAINNKDLDVYMDSQKVGQSVTQYQNSMARRFGY